MLALLVDKSALQSLNPKELRASHHLYRILATDVLLVELLGDMRYGDRRIQRLSSKLRSAQVVVNMPYHLICRAELMGEPVCMQGVPILQRASLLDSGEGGDLLARWAEGRFTEGDLQRAKTWLDALRGLELAQVERWPCPATAPSIGEIARWCDAFLTDPTRERVFLGLLLSYLPLTEQGKREIHDRWQDLPLRLLSDAPFSAHCVRVLWIFLTAVRSRLVGARNSNFADLQYLMYLPFCSRFASGDHVHAALFPFVSAPDQVLVLPNQLKVELGSAYRSA